MSDTLRKLGGMGPTEQLGLAALMDKLERELVAANELLDQENCPREYVRVGDTGPTYCLHGTSSISAYHALERKLAAAQSVLEAERKAREEAETDMIKTIEQWDACRLELAATQEEVTRYQEKADAIHRYLNGKKDTALFAVITELSIDAERRAKVKEGK